MKKIIYFSPISWNALKARPQHIAEELSKIYYVYYIEPSSSFINNKYDYKDSIISKSVMNRLQIIKIIKNLRLPKCIEIIDLFNLNTFYERKILNKYLKEADIIWLGSPIYYSVIKNIKNKIVVYDKMDDESKLTKNILLKIILKKYDNKLLEKASIVFTSSNYLFKMARRKNKNVILVNNAFDKKMLSTPNIPSDNFYKLLSYLKKENKLLFGYIGTIDYWFDFDAIYNILNFNRDFFVIIIGKNNVEKINHERILYHDSVNKEELPFYINIFDFCLYTFKKNCLLDTIDPIKIYEYLGFNKKVIAVKSAETIKFKDNIILYDNIEELTDILKRLKEINKPFDDRSLNKFIIQNSWEGRAKYIIENLNNLS